MQLILLKRIDNSSSCSKKVEFWSVQESLLIIKIKSWDNQAQIICLMALYNYTIINFTSSLNSSKIPSYNTHSVTNSYSTGIRSRITQVHWRHEPKASQVTWLTRSRWSVVRVSRRGHFSRIRGYRGEILPFNRHRRITWRTTPSYISSNLRPYKTYKLRIIVKNRRILDRMGSMPSSWKL